MSFPRYEKYKDSGVEWLGEVPEHWRVVPLRALAKVVSGYPFDAKLFDPANGFPLVRIRDLNQATTDTRYRGEFIDAVSIDSSDVLIGMDGDFNVGRWLGEEAALLNQRMCCVRAETPATTRYLEYVLPTPLNAINALTYATTVKHLSSFDVLKIRVAMPPSDAEVAAIVRFLNHETAKIDNLVEEQKRLIELLKEKRQAVISHTVTKGLNPHAPMKDSGVEWLGEVPAHWEVRSLRTLASIVRGASPRPAGDPVYFDGEYIPWVTVAEITKDDLVDLTGTDTFLTESGAAHSRTFQSGTVIYSNSGATLGVPKILRLDACANDGVVGFERLSESLRPLFLYHYLCSLTQTIREMVKQGSGQPNLNTSIVKAIPIALPSPDEQARICEYVESVTRRFRELTTGAESAMALLQERRTALISAAVTGKIDVRNSVNQEELEAA